jgi:hypothetical protein
MKIVTAPEEVNLDVFYNNPSLFLAGSIEQGKAVDWQKVTLSQLGDMDITVFNPRRAEWDSTWTEDDPRFIAQVHWELTALDHVAQIIMHFEPDTLSPITLLELGLYAGTGRLIVSCPPGFYRRGNVRIVCAKYSIPCYDSLQKAIDAVRNRLT